MGWQSLDTSRPHIILDLAKPAPPWPGKQHFLANHLFQRKETLIWPFLRPSTSQHSCIVGFQETLGGKRKKSNLQRTNGTVKTFSSKGQLWPFLTASIFHICRQYLTRIIQNVCLAGISGIQESLRPNQFLPFSLICSRCQLTGVATLGSWVGLLAGGWLIS